jgi:hypothetical protein
MLPVFKLDGDLQFLLPRRGRANDRAFRYRGLQAD